MTKPEPARTIQVDLGAVQKCVEVEFGRLSARVAELRMAVLATGDGRYLGGWFPEQRSGQRLSAIASSLLAICETAGKEIDAGACESAIVVANRLNTVVVRVSAIGRQLVLATAFRSELLLGAAVRHTGDAAARLAVAVDLCRRPA